MNSGTRIRTIALAFTIINKVMVDLGTIDFGNEKVNIAYKVISTLVLIIASGFALYFNNDFTEEACIGTAVTRQLKAEKKDDYVGDTFFDEDIFFEDIDEAKEETDEQQDI